MGVSQTPWQAACELHAALRVGGTLPPVGVPSPIARPCDPGEYPVGMFGPPTGLHLNYARFLAMDVVVHNRGPAVLVGTPHFLTGYALGSIAKNHWVHKRAQRMAQPQWHSYPMGYAVVTTHRVWCNVAGEWKWFTYADTADLRLDDHHALVMCFADVPAVRLGGPWAPWIAVAVAHLRYGPDAESYLSWLARFRIPSRTPL